MRRRLILFIIGLALSVSPVAAQDFSSFEIEDIRVLGLRRFDPGVVFNRLKVEPGERFTSDNAVVLIQELYKSGYFSSVEVLRDGNVLVVRVRENPTIAEVDFSGVSELNNDNLLEMLNNGGITKGRVFDRNLFDEAANAIEQAYADRNFPQAKIKTVVSPLPRNRVALLFDVEEGPQATLRSIDIRGNENFSNWTIKQNMEMETKGLFNFFSSSHVYSETRLQADVERIRTFYLEAGYLRFAIEDARAEKSEDETDIDIVIEVKEGSRYLVSEYVLDGALPTDDVEFQSFVFQDAGEVFSSQQAEETAAAVRNYLGDLGYVNANVYYETMIDDNEGAVRAVFKINAGPVAYVRRIDITGNERTADQVIRREFLQLERERYSREKVEKSRSRLRRLGYFEDVRIEIRPVSDNSEEVDLNVTIVEGSAGKVGVGVGYSSDKGASLNGSFENPNIFGTGNDFEVSGSWSDDIKSLDLTLDQLYYTDEGVSRHMALQYSEYEASDSSSTYNIDTYGGEFGYGFPFTDEAKYYIYAAYEKIGIRNASALETAYQPFIQKHGENFDIALLKLGLLHDSRDSALTPSSGHRANLNGQLGLPFLDLSYYHAEYQHDYYQTLRRLPSKPILHLRGGLGFGDSYNGDVFPFYHRFYLGGSETLRGFNLNSIGYENNANNQALGGKTRLYGRVEISFDTDFFSTQQIFLAPFLDAGVVGREIGKFGDIRASGGLELRWVSPIGPLRFAYVKDIESQSEDDTEEFQFSVGTF